MVTWLTRSLLFIVVGAVLAYAVTVRNGTVDIQTTGVILLLVGIFDLLLNFGLTMYLRRPVRSDEWYREAGRSSYEARPAPRPAARESASRAASRPRAYPDLADDGSYPTRPIRRDGEDTWH